MQQIRTFRQTMYVKIENKICKESCAWQRTNSDFSQQSDAVKRDAIR